MYKKRVKKKVAGTGLYLPWGLEIAAHTPYLGITCNYCKQEEMVPKQRVVTVMEMIQKNVLVYLSELGAKVVQIGVTIWLEVVELLVQNLLNHLSKNLVNYLFKICWITCPRTNCWITCSKFAELLVHNTLNYLSKCGAINGPNVA